MSVARILVIDAGTTGTRALVYDKDSAVLAQSYTEFPQYHPGPDRVEHDAQEIWEATLLMVHGALAKAGLQPGEITTIGITNQRATTVVWDRRTGDPITRAIVWQDTRTADRAAELAGEWGEKVYSRTGWSLAPVYSSLSLEWILANVEGARELADAGHLAFGTIDSWLIHRLTGGAEHVISASNASVTGSYDLLSDTWYTEWLQALCVPVAMYPEVRDDSGDLGTTDPAVFGAAVPIAALVLHRLPVLLPVWSVWALAAGPFLTACMRSGIRSDSAEISAPDSAVSALRCACARLPRPIRPSLGDLS